jgi:hypothetical protein
MANVNKVTYGGNTLIDLTSDTVTADTLASGVTAHSAKGAVVTGTASISKPKVPTYIYGKNLSNIGTEDETYTLYLANESEVDLEGLIERDLPYHDISIERYFNNRGNGVVQYDAGSKWLLQPEEEEVVLNDAKPLITRFEVLDDIYFDRLNNFMVSDLWERLEYIDVSKLHKTPGNVALVLDGVFMNLLQLKELHLMDLSEWVEGGILNVDAIIDLIYVCPNLETIYATTDYYRDEYASVFGDTAITEVPAIVGGEGTGYLGDDANYLRIDNPEYSGYFTRQYLDAFTGATKIKDGIEGLVPAMLVQEGDFDPQDYFLNASGEWLKPESVFFYLDDEGDLCQKESE